MLNETNELMVGELTNEEFAQWKGVKETTIRAHKAKYLKELDVFADFHLEGKKVIIDKVLIPKYEKAGILNYEKVKERIPAHLNYGGIDNCKSISNKMKKEFTQMKDSTRYSNVLKGVKELYPNREGVWVLKIDEYTVREMTAEEFEVFKETIRECLGSTEDKQLLVEAMVRDGSLAEADAWRYYRELVGLNNAGFYEILKRTTAKLNGLLPVRGFYARNNVLKDEK